ncbi:hypothetical protein CPLU01_11890 [Colletotrichum plurivorum]|uniref:Uncharacterized protein n=1 Tax=Colletotrichum plurivorum TaxID=2175906 RepID=A0A8H6N7U7_9PEZI|nr:hypothetical protein CPLU01_11890 [Colletotrichum plurivorum]
MARHTPNDGASPAPNDPDERSPRTHLLQTTASERKPSQNIWLTRAVLVAFAIVSISCAAALLGLSRLVSSLNGLPLSISSSNYSWTYGPTAVLVIILAIWRQVDYHCRSMQPWWELSSGPSPAFKSVLVDYISPFQPMACVRAFRNGHYAVFLSILGFLLLKLIILLSTTLFFVQPTLHSETVTVRYLDHFDTESMWGRFGYYESLYGAGYDATIRASWQGASIRLPTLASNLSTISFPVDSFVPDISCEEASILILPTNISIAWYDLESPNCSAKEVLLNPTGCLLDTECPAKRSFHDQDMYLVDCTPMHTTGSNDNADSILRYAIIVGSYNIGPKDENGYNIVTKNNAAAVFCKVSYGLISATATQDLSNDQITFEHTPGRGNDTRLLPDLTEYEFASIFHANLQAASSTLRITPEVNVRYSPPIFQILAAGGNWAEIQDTLSKPSVLREVATEVLTGIANSFAKTSLLVEDLDQHPVEAMSQISTNKLHAGAQPIRAGIHCFPGSSPCNSPSMLKTLRHVGPSRWSELAHILKSMHFTALNGKALSIKASGESLVTCPSAAKAEKAPWMPLSARFPMVVLLFVQPILLVSILEVLGRISDQRKGFFSLESSNFVELSFVVRLASTLLVFTTGTMFTNLDSTISIFAPFSTLLVVSGLWVVGDPVQSYWTTQAAAQTWDRAWLAGNSTDNGAAVALNVIRHGGGRAPLTFRGDYGVLPRITPQILPASSRTFHSTYNTTILRPAFECDTLPQEAIVLKEITHQANASWNADDVLVKFTAATITLNGTLPPNCASKSHKEGIGGPKLNLNYDDSRRYDDPEKGDTGDTDIAAMELYSDEAKRWWNETDGEKNLAFKLKRFLSASLTVPSTPTTVGHRESFYFDIFFQHLTSDSGSYNNISAQFVGPENAERLKITVTQSYKEYMAHVIDLNFRSPDTMVIQGVASEPITRISIHPTSKLVLQALLATMTVLELVAYKLVKLRGTLPRNPCSIASTMGFLADSQLCDPGSGILPKNAAVMSEKELAQSLHGYVFSLGWWGGAGDRTKMTDPSAEEETGVERKPEPEVERTNRFGIDVGHADALGFCGKPEPREARLP